MTKKIEDASSDRSTNWDSEVERGHLVNVSGQGGREKASPGGEHLQGIPLTEAEKASRVVSGKSMERVMEEARQQGSRAIRPEKPSTRVGLGAPSGGWPRFDQHGKIVP